MMGLLAGKRNSDMKTKVSEAKLSSDEFNSCPGLEKVWQMLDGAIGEDDYMFVDSTDTPYWVNAEDTVVIEIIGKAGLGLGLRIGEAAMDLGVDELQHNWNESGRLIVRLWWD